MSEMKTTTSMCIESLCLTFEKKDRKIILTKQNNTESVGDERLKDLPLLNKQKNIL